MSAYGSRRAGARCEAELCRPLLFEIEQRRYESKYKTVFKMAVENAILNATEALRPLRNEVDNFFLSKEVKTALTSIFGLNFRIPGH